MSKVTISQLTTHRSHTHTALSSDENQYLVWPPHASMHMHSLHRRFLQEKWNRFPQVRIQTLINSMRIRIEACQRPTRYWFSSLDNLCVCVCVWSVCLSYMYEIVTFFLLYPALIKCAVKLTLFFQFRWKLVWMCMNGSSPLRYHITNHYVNTGIDSYCVCCVIGVS